MAKPNGTAAGSLIKSTTGEEDVNPRWGTWEELLLACAVNRYGTDDWDSVAAEVQKRSSSANPLLLTPPNCLKKYLQLTRHISDDSAPLLEELRKLRVAELRRELERYDLSIVSLQSKVNKMKEERARSSSENKDRNSSDLCSTKEEEKKVVIDRNLPEVKDESEKSPVSVAGKAVTGEESELISIDRRTVQNDEIRAEIVTEEKPVVREDSCYGSSDSVEKEEPASVRKGVKAEPGSASPSPELVESVAESKGEEGGGTTATTKEDCSDVQSSATKSRRDGDSDLVLRGSSDPDDLENKRESPALKLESSVESQPFIDFLDDFTRYKLGSVFSRRLDVQETPSYKNLIRRHVDLEMVQTRVKQGVYLDSHLKFFRDLLLLANNATVFFNKNTTEFAVATELRNLISNKLSQKPAKSDSTSGKQSSLPRVHPPKKDDSEPSESLPLKPKLGGPLIFCRKRSSIAGKATPSSSGSDKKKEQLVSKSSQEKVVPEATQLLPNKAEEPRVTKKRSRDRFSSGSTELKKNGNGKNFVSKPTSGSSLDKSQGKGGSSSQQPEPRGESKSKSASVDLKKRGAANFLNRMKQNSSPNSSPLLDALKSAPLRAGSEQKKSENAKGSGKKEQVPSKGSDSKQTNEKEKASPAKKTLGRPTKKSTAKATPPTPTSAKATPPTPPSAKRNRELKESESAATNHKRKRSRK